MDDEKALLSRIAEALERLAPPPLHAKLSGADAFHWDPRSQTLAAVAQPMRAPLELLLEVERQKEALLANTRRFAAGAPANNALLWGARGTGKSALVKAVHAKVLAETPGLKLIEAPPEDLSNIGVLIDALRAQPARAILFLDDLSFAGNEAAHKALKPALEGALRAGADNLIVYATSNRRHLVERDLRENTPGDIMWADAAEEHLALADRFGLWLGFHSLDQIQFLRIVSSYAQRLQLPIKAEELEREALLWSRTRAARSGRTAWQLILDLAGRLNREVKF